MAQEKQVAKDGSTFQRMVPLPSKISEEKLYNYIKKMEVDGLPRVRAYAEAIDSHIYDLPPSRINDVLDGLKRRAKGYDEIKEMVLAEQQNWALRRSSAVQDKAMNLLTNLLDKANEIATKPDADTKELAQAVSMLRTIMPAFNAVNNTATKDISQTDRKKRAAGYIN